ncbi:MAG: glycosyltransferase family 4 protein [Bacteroidota bacterium]
MKLKKKLLFFVTEDWYFYSHRLPLAIAAKKSGYDVSVVTRIQSHGDKITDAGIKVLPLKLSRRGINPLNELRVIKQLVSIYKKEQPDIVHHVALKPVLYGTVAARLARVSSIVNAMAGLGFIFSSKKIKARVVRPFLMFFFKLLLNNPCSRIILQNADDASLLHKSGVLKKERIALIRGSGVDTNEYLAQPEADGEPIIILASRLLWDKGVGEFVDASRILQADGVKARFALLGEGDPENPGSISNEQLISWENEGIVEVWGKKTNMPEVFSQVHIVCLPSFYGEGVPKVLIEAASCGKPIVTTNAPGCRDIVRDGVNGLLVPLRDSVAVADALKKLIQSPELRKQMGEKGRALVESDFSLKKVNSETLSLYKELLL